MHDEAVYIWHTLQLHWMLHCITAWRSVVAEWLEHLTAYYWSLLVRAQLRSIEKLCSPSCEWVPFRERLKGSERRGLGHVLNVLPKTQWAPNYQLPNGCKAMGHLSLCRGRQYSFVEIDHEIFSTVILSLLLIQEGQLSVSGKRMCTSTG